MVQAVINISEETNQVLAMIKARYSLPDKSKAIDLMAKQYAENLHEKPIRPEYAAKILRISQGTFHKVNDVSRLEEELGLCTPQLGQKKSKKSSKK